MEKSNKYYWQELDMTVECITCRSKKELAMFAHRNNDHIVGWIFLCKKCQKHWEDSHLELHWLLKDETGKIYRRSL